MLGTSPGEKIKSATTRVFTICLLIFSATTLVYGQGAYGTIRGTVTDNSGSVLANAGVDVTNIGTNVTKHVLTTSSGDYTVPYLQPGAYRVTVQAQGFQKSITDNSLRPIISTTRRAAGTFVPSTGHRVPPAASFGATRSPDANSSDRWAFKPKKAQV